MEKKRPESVAMVARDQVRMVVGGMAASPRWDPRPLMRTGPIDNALAHGQVVPAVRGNAQRTIDARLADEGDLFVPLRQIPPSDLPEPRRGKIIRMKKRK